MASDRMPRADAPRNDNAAELAAKIAKAAPYLAALLEIFTTGTAAPSPDDLLPETEACRYAACSKRTLSDARKRNEIPSYGRQRDRAYRRADLDKWIESRRVIHEAVDDLDIERRMKRIAGGR